MILIVSIIIIILLIFFYDKSQQNIKIGKEGGMKQKYKGLINHFLSGHENSRIIQETRDSIVVGSNSIGGSTYFNIVQTFSKVTIQWKCDVLLYGKHKLEWTFPEYMNQDQMISKICNDLEAYQKNVMSL
jgi:hypothetical protein